MSSELKDLHLNKTQEKTQSDFDTITDRINPTSAPVGLRLALFPDAATQPQTPVKFLNLQATS